MALIDSSGLKIDAYLLWAIETKLTFFEQRHDIHVVLLVNFAKPIDKTMLKRMASAGMFCSELFEDYSCASVDAPFATLSNSFQVLHALSARYCELATPIPPTRFVASERVLQVDLGKAPDVVIGIVDDGCPFAHQAYRPGADPAASVRFIWDQGDLEPDPAVKAPAHFGYGAVYSASYLDQLLAKAKGNEDSAYALTALPSLDSALSHGAQVMGHAAGRTRPIDGRPPFPPLTGRTDIAFVQLPAQALDDPSGIWLESYGLAGLHAIRHYGRKMFSKPAAKIIANLSYGPQTGAHDGSSVVEIAIAEMYRRARDHGYIFRVILPSGNSHLLRAHAQIDLKGLTTSGRSIDWYVAADSQVVSLLEIWFPSGVGFDDVDVQVDSPAGDSARASDPPPPPAAVVRVSTVEGPAPANRLQCIIGTAPTARSCTASAPDPDAFALAPPGRWRVTVMARPGANPKVLDGVAHAYLARSDPNLGRPQLGRSGYLESPNYDDPCGTPPSEHLDPFPLAGPAEVVARGSINGIATGPESMVAAGFRLSDGRPAPYSSGGPSTGDSAKGDHITPDWAYPTEESRVRSGLLGLGNRSRVALRLSGTSTAAPQMARELAATPGDHFPVPPAPPSAPKPPWFTLRFGNGRR